MLSRLREVIEDPVAAGYRVRGRFAPRGLFERQARLARAAGIDRVWLILSFDCDTREDAQVAGAVHERLAGMGVTPVYAVPGKRLEADADVYRRLADSGAEFINHGHEEHTYFDEDAGHFRSRWFYDEEPRDAVRADIEGGHETVTAITGTQPVGFRAPHFGTFQAPDELRFVHEVARGLGCRFASTTMPLWGLREGPLFRRFGLPEFPVTGPPSSPLGLLDTWGHFAAPDRVREPEDFVSEGKALAEVMRSVGAGIINVYGDPSHVADREDFFETVALWREVAEPVGYSELLARLSD